MENSMVVVKVTQLCLTLCDPMDYTEHGILQARIQEWVAFSFSRGSSPPRNHTHVSRIAGRLFTTWATREAQIVWRFLKKLKTELPYDPDFHIPIAGYILEENENTNSKDTCIPMFIAALFTIAKIWKQTKCPSPGEWILDPFNLYLPILQNGCSNSAYHSMLLENSVLIKCSATVFINGKKNFSLKGLCW